MKAVDRDEAVQDLANAIVVQAAEDYREALVQLKYLPNDWRAKSKVQEIERFFRSAWYRLLTKVDAETLMRRLRAEVDT